MSQELKNEIFSFSRWWFWNTCIFVWPITPVSHLLCGQPHLLKCYYQNCLIGKHMCVHSVSEWSVFFTLQCELFTSCNVSNNASLVSAWTGVEGEGGGQPNKDRPWQGEGSPKKCPNLWGHPLSMTPKFFIKKRLQRKYFPVDIAKFLRTAFVIEHWWLLSTWPYYILLVIAFSSCAMS